MEEFFFIKEGKRFLKLNYKNIVMLKAMGNYVQIVTSDSAKHLHYSSLKALIEKLPDQFMRVHNSYIVNISHIEKIEDNHVFFGDYRIPVSTNNRPCLFERVNKSLL